MLILEAVLGAEDLALVQAELATFEWLDGKATAGGLARPVKDNRQARGDDERVQALEKFIAAALDRHQVFTKAARPKRMSRMIFSRYEAGMAYGRHTDDAIMGGRAAPIRTDLAYTLFLADQKSYEGGALAIETSLGAPQVKLKAGDAILYSAGTIHAVMPVTSGARMVCVGWVESMVRDAAQRAMLFDLAVVRANLADAGAERDHLLALDQVQSNLLRMWAQP
jgi:PKHD-type hydroxylase